MRNYTILCLMLLAVVQTSRAQLNGNYTVGGAGANFPTFGTAVAALTTQGISGNVTFRVRPGQYEERFEINAIPGANTNRRVVFESENSDSSSVRLFTDTANAGNNWVVSLQNVGQITFRHLSFVAPSTGLYGIVLSAFNCTNLLIEHCAFSGIRTGFLYNNTQNTVNIAGNCPGFQFRNCLVQGGYRALSFNGPGANTPLLNGVITGNRFTGAAAQAIRIFYVDNLDISDNLFEDNADQTSYIALDIQESDNLRVLRNTIRKFIGVGINLNNCRSTGNNRGLVANNMIAIGSAASDNTGTGMLLSGVWNADLWHNSLNLFGTGPGQHYGIRLDNSSRFLRLQNTTVSGLPGAILVSTVTNPDVFTAYSHCNLYSTDPPPALPPNSVSLKPNFVSDTDLHLTNTNLSNRGIPVAVGDDIDGDPRDPLTPDIGADEYTPNLRSAGLVRFISPTTDQLYCDTLPLTVVLINSGTEPLTSAGIEVRWNGTLWATVAWAGNLASGESEEIALGNVILVPFVANQIDVSVKQPNGLTDDFPDDDSLVFNNAFAGFSGTYTIGGADGNFPNLGAAFKALQNGGLCGHTELLVRDGVYAEQIYVDAPIKGSAPDRRLTLRGESGDSSAVQIVAAGTLAQNTTFRMDGATYLLLKNLTIRQTANVSNNNAALLIVGGHDISLENCVVAGHLGTSRVAMTAKPDSNFTIRHCVFSGGETPVLMTGNNIKFNLIFSHNQVFSGDDDAIWMEYWRNVRIEDNVISSFSNSSHFGIYGLGIRDFDIRNNRVRVAGPQASVGIYLKNCGRFSRTSVLANNAVAMNLGTGIIAIGRGMWLIGCSDIQVLHNSVYHLSDDADNFAFAVQQSDDMTLLNNVFVNGSAGRAFYSFGNSNLVSDYNVFFSKSGTLGETVNDLPGLQALTGGDQHSVVGDPGWMAPEPDSLALRNAALENIGTATSITTDILGRPRQLPAPDPGAFETPMAPLVQLGADTIVCGSLLLDGFAPGATTYLWNTGATQPAIVVEVSGIYILTASNGFGTHTDTVQVTVVPLPDPPVVLFENNILRTTAAGALQWWLNGQPIPGAVGDTLLPTANGWYQAQVTEAGLCSAFSDSVHIVLVHAAALAGASPLHIFPNPAGQTLWIAQWPGDISDVQVVDLLGRILPVQVLPASPTAMPGVDVGGLPAGVYWLCVRDRNGQLGRGLFVKQ